MTLYDNIKEIVNKGKGPEWVWNSDYEVVESEIVDQTRWNTINQDVIRSGDEYVMVEYAEGSTEEQETDWEDYPPEIQRVEPVEVVAIKYVPVEP